MYLEFLNKRIPLWAFLASLFGASVLVYSLGYKMAMDKFNDVVSYVQEKQRIYSTLSELDHNIRSEYVSDIPESDVLNSACKGYLEGLNDGNCTFWNKQEYKDYQEAEKKLKPNVDYKMLKENIAYIKCDRFVNGASQNVVERIDSAFVGGINGLVLDLRNCEKSDDEEIFKILQHVIPSGDIVNVINKNNEMEVACKSTSEGINLNFVVLVNEKTSGGAEVLASALKCSKGAKIVGTRTAGNPVRRKKITLSDESVVVFPDAHYVAKGGNDFFKKGLTPDFITEASVDGDAQLEKALDLIMANDSK